jgi:hypothetical protein
MPCFAGLPDDYNSRYYQRQGRLSQRRSRDEF